MRILRFFVMAGALSGALFAQEGAPVKFGLLGGVQITDMFRANNTGLFDNQIPNSNYTSGVPRYEFGASSEFALFGPLKRLKFEVDGIYKRGGLEFTTPATGLDSAYNRVTFNNWEIPGVFKYNFTLGHVRPFVDLGASFRHISGISNFGYPAGYQTPLTLDDNVGALHNRNSYGGVAGFGVTFKAGPVSVSPQVRYTRWANQSFDANGLRTNLDEGDALIGFTF